MLFTTLIPRWGLRRSPPSTAAEDWRIACNSIPLLPISTDRVILSIIILALSSGSEAPTNEAQTNDQVELYAENQLSLTLYSRVGRTGHYSRKPQIEAPWRNEKIAV
jgi:hypothetical protein